MLLPWSVPCRSVILAGVGSNAVSRDVRTEPDPSSTAVRVGDLPSDFSVLGVSRPLWHVDLNAFEAPREHVGVPCPRAWRRGPCPSLAEQGLPPAASRKRSKAPCAAPQRPLPGRASSSLVSAPKPQPVVWVVLRVVHSGPPRPRTWCTSSSWLECPWCRSAFLRIRVTIVHLVFRFFLDDGDSSMLFPPQSSLFRCLSGLRTPEGR